MGILTRRRLLRISACLAAAAALGPADARQETGLRVLSGFPGASAKLESIDAAARTIKILPATHPDRGWVCWWFFKVEGMTPGEAITLDVGGGVWATPDRAAMSSDGKTWVQTPPGARVEANRIRYRVEPSGTEAWFAWGPPFVLKDAREAIEQAVRACPQAKAFELCRSRDGHSVPAIRFAPAGAARFGLWIQARQHAWESGGSSVCRGFLDWLASGDPRAAALREHAEVVVVPIMDADNAERGAGGKEGQPQDHNRDWSDNPHWPEVRAAQEGIRRMAEAGRFQFFMDLHNPGASARELFFFLCPSEGRSERARRNQEAFLEAAKADMVGPLKFAGRTQESGPKYDRNWDRMSNNWVARTAPEAVAVTLETAWNTPHSTPEGYARVGRELGQAIERYFREAAR